MANNFIYAISTVKYGTPTGTATMPASGSMTAINTVKGSVTMDETEATTVEFYEDQSPLPVNSAVTDNGKFTAGFQAYNLDFAALAVLKGGTGTVSGWTPATGATQIKLALELVTVSGHKFEFYNAAVISRITGGLSNDKMLTLDVKAVPLMPTSGVASMYVSKI